MACGIWNNTEAHHVKSRGAGGGDDPWNILPLCTWCHKKWHDLGVDTFLKQHEHIMEYLVKLGWVYDRELFRDSQL